MRKGCLFVDVLFFCTLASVMAKFKCNKCEEVKELSSYSIKVIDDKVVSPEAICCDEHMDRVKEDNGFGGIIKKPNGTVSGKF